MKVLLVLAVMTATCGQAHAAAVKYESLGKYVKIADSATGYIEAFGAIGGTGASSTALLNSGWLDFTHWTSVTWDMPPSSGWATLYIEGANSATAPAYSEGGAQVNKIQPVGANGIGYIVPCPRFLRWYIADPIAAGVSACIRWRATR